jgi:hypothetical protein
MKTREKDKKMIERKKKRCLDKLRVNKSALRRKKMCAN